MKTLGSKAYIYLTKSTIWLKTIKPIEKLVWTNIYIYIYTKFPKYVPYYQKKIKRPTNSSRLTHHPSPK